MNRAFLYGDGFFESLRMINGVIPMISYHLERIEEGMSILGLESKVAITEDLLMKTIRSKTQEDNLKIRINFYRDGEGKYTPKTNEMRIHMSWEKTLQDYSLPNNELDEYINNLEPKERKIAIATDWLKPIHPMFSIKTLSSAYYVKAGMIKEEAEAHHIIILNQHGLVVEELSSNIYIPQDQHWLTPSLSGGCINGVIRRFLIKNFPNKIQQTQVNLGQLREAEYLLLSNGSSGIRKIKPIWV